MDEQIDLTQLDLNDPETRSWAQSNMDLSDPETKKFFEASAPKETPSVATQPNDFAARKTKYSFGERFDDAIKAQGGWAEYVQPDASGFAPLDAVNNAVVAGGTLGVRGYQALMAGLEAGAYKLDDLSRYTGLADLPSQIGIENKILPGTAIMALAEALPLGGIEAGLPVIGANAGLRNMIKNETRAAEKGASGVIEQNGQQFRGYYDEATGEWKFEGKGPGEDALRAEAEAFKPKPEPTVEDLWSAPKTFDEAAATAKLEDEVAAFKARQAPEGLATEAQAFKEVTPRVEEGVNQINEITQGWKNPPEFKVHPSFDDLAFDSDALGVVGPDGKVHINMSMVDGPADIKAVTFHEALGHNGLTQLFTDRLDKTLEGFYDRSSWFRDKVDDWIEQNGNPYGDRPDSLARAADEVFAEMSEKGTTYKEFYTIQNRLKNLINSVARRVGFTKDMSERELSTILATAHNRVINGESGVIADGLRYMKKRPKKGLTQNIGGKTDEEGFEKFIQGEVEPVTGGVVSDIELSRMADDYGMTTAKMKKGGLEEGQLAAQLLAGRRHYARLRSELLDLGTQARELDGTIPPTLYAKLQMKLNDVRLVRARLENDAAEIARAQRSNRLIARASKNEQALDRYMKRASESGEPLSNPQAADRFLEALDDIDQEGGEGAIIKEVNQAKKYSFVQDIMNAPRALMSSLDLSAPFRQGLFFVGEKEFWKGLPGMWKQFRNDEYHREVMREIRARPTYKMMMRSGLETSEYGGDISKHEEMFMSRLAAKAPWVKMSERAYSGFLNKLRADMFDKLIKEAEEAGVELMRPQERYANGNYRPDKATDALKDIAGFINNATGRGDFGETFNRAVPLLNNIFFSPRLMASRAQMLNPRYYVRLSPIARRQALRSLIRLGGISMAVTGLAKLGGASVEDDPRSSDYGKVRVGDTRYDIGGGFNQWVTLGARLATGQTKTLGGEVKDLGEGYGSDDEWDVIVKFFRNKLSPTLGTAVNIRTGKSPVGEEVTPASEIGKLFYPMIINDIQGVREELDDENPVKAYGKALATVSPSIVGIGSQTFSTTSKVLNETATDADRPVLKELKGIEKSVGKSLVSPVSNSFKFEGEEVKLDKTQQKEWQTLTNQYIIQDIKDEMNSNDWSSLSNEDKQKVISDIVRDAKKDAKEELFGDLMLEDEDDND